MAGTRPRQALRGPVSLAAVSAFLILILIAGAYAAVTYLRVDEIELPDVEGMPFEAAADLLRSHELVPVSYPDNLPGAEPGTVTAQTPQPGAVVRQGRSVSIGVHRPPEAARAPVLTGLTEEQAANTAGAVNLELQSISYRHSSQPAGRVIEQIPEAGEVVSAEEGMTIVVSRGPEQASVVMPDLDGTPVEAARQQLEQMGFRSINVVATGVTFDSPGTVVAQEPAAEESVPLSLPVVLSYRLPAREVVEVPDMVGRSARAATRMLQGAGLRIGEIRYADAPDSPSNSVLEMSPSGYTLRGTPIALTVNAATGSLDELEQEFAGLDDDFDLFGNDRDGSFGNRPGFDQGALGDGLDRNGDLSGLSPGTRVDSGGFDDELGETGRRVTVNFDPATLGVRSLLEQPYDLRLVVQDDQGERTVVDRRVRAGESVSAVVVVHGDALLQTFINDIFFQAWRP